LSHHLKAIVNTHNTLLIKTEALGHKSVYMNDASPVLRTEVKCYQSSVIYSCSWCDGGVPSDIVHKIWSLWNQSV